ncbi:MAG: hypothetical protein J6S83_04745 [Lachnospiraceae bacterium]|nr:hypothetical protein [Lachnospiraceae bacterium]
MENYLFLTTQNESGGLSPAAMTIIAMLLLLLPYLLHRYTGRSLTEWLRLGVIMDALEGLADRIRGVLFGNRGGMIGKRLGTDFSKAQTGSKGKSRQAEREEAARKAAAIRQEERERSLEKKRAGNIQNDYLQAISRILTFARRFRLFAIIPGNIEHEGKTAELTAILVTHARVVGIMAYGFNGKVLCRQDDQPWQLQEKGGTRQIGCLGRESRAQGEIVSGALRDHGMDDIPYETVQLFTSSGAVLAGDKPENAYTGEELFKALSTEADLRSGPLNPKDIGKKIGALRTGKTKK